MAGDPLFWPSSCAWFGVQKDGSPKRHITYETLHTAVSNAFDKWAKADCGGGRVPSFTMQDTDELYGPVVCAKHEFNKTAANACAWMFRDSDWPYNDPTTTIALTTLSVEISTGRILDADVEINSFATNITTSDVNVGADLDSVVTHEAGHFLGMAHSAVRDATMYRNYSPASTSIRVLSTDDQDGICEAYPDGAPPESCGPPEPLYGFSKNCAGADPSTAPVSGEKKSSCAIGNPATTGNGAAALSALLVAGVAALRRRRHGW